MKKGLIIFATLVVFGITSFAAYAGWGWKVYAESPSAYGYGISYSYESAANRALVECARRTPAHQTCYVTGREQWWID